MAILTKVYKNLKFIHIENLSDIPYDEWKWREVYINLTGDLLLFISTTIEPGKAYVSFKTSDGIFNTSPCTLEETGNQIIVITRTSKYTFEYITKMSTEKIKDSMPNFAAYTINKKTFSGESKKISINFNDSNYIVKFPLNAPVLSSCVSEYIASHIFNELGVPAQETVLGVFNTETFSRNVVACKELGFPEEYITTFLSLINSVIDINEYKPNCTEISYIMTICEKQSFLSPNRLKQRFWDMFVIDALIATPNRNNENWGFLYHDAADRISFAPVFSSSKSLFLYADEVLINGVINGDRKSINQIIKKPTSILLSDGKPINYFTFITSLQNADCNDAIKRVVPRIDINKIERIVDDIPNIPDLHKEFYKTILYKRKEKILDIAYSKLIS